jgi:hypothetical protein
MEDLAVDPGGHDRRLGIHERDARRGLRDPGHSPEQSTGAFEPTARLEREQERDPRSDVVDGVDESGNEREVVEDPGFLGEGVDP